MKINHPTEAEWRRLTRMPYRRTSEPADVTSGPSLPRMAVNLAKAVGRVVAAKARGEPVRVTPEVKRARDLMCCGDGDKVEKCKYWDGAARGGLGKCRDQRCGCTGLKREFATEKCPRGYW